MGCCFGEGAGEGAGEGEGVEMGGAGVWSMVEGAGGRIEAEEGGG